jgi:hypothetical protein
MRVATIYWDGEEAIVKWTEAFLLSDWLIRADAIQDIEQQIGEQYKVALHDFEKWHKKTQKSGSKTKGKKS